MFLLFDVLVALDAQPIPRSLAYLAALWHLLEVCLAVISARPQGLGQSAVFLANPMYFPQYGTGIGPGFIVLWGIILGLTLFPVIASFVCARYCSTPRRGSSVAAAIRWIWLCGKSAFLLVGTAAFLPCLGVMASPLFCDSDTNTVRAFRGEGSQLACWSTAHFPLFVLSVCGYALLAMTGLVLRLAAFDASPLSPDLLARAHGRCDAFAALWLAAVALIGSATRQGAAAYPATFAVCAAVTAVSYATVQPYYSTLVNQIHAAGYALASWLSVVAAAGIDSRTSAVGVLVFCVSWFLAGLRVRRRPVLLFDGVAGKWTARYPIGLHVARRRSSLFMYGQEQVTNADGPEATAALLDSSGSRNNPDGQQEHTPCRGASVFRAVIPTDVELATRFLLTPATRELHRQGRQSLSTNRWSRALTAVADQYYQRGLRRFPQSPLLRLQHARFLVLWQSAYEAAHQVLLDLAHDPSVPLDIRYFALKEQMDLRGALDLDSATANMLRKARDEHLKALNSLLAFLREVKARQQLSPQGQSTAQDFSSLSHLAHMLSHRRGQAREMYREALSRRQRLDRGTLQHWALFLEHLMLDHAAAQRTYEYIERVEAQSLSQRSGFTGVSGGSGSGSSSTGTSTEIPGLAGEAAGTSSRSDAASAGETQALGVARLLRKNIQVAFLALVCLVCCVVAVHFSQERRTSEALDRLHTVGELRALTFQAAVMAAERQRRLYNSGNTTNLLGPAFLPVGVAFLPGTTNGTDGYAAMSDAQLLDSMVDIATRISATHATFVSQGYHNDFPRLQLSHSALITPVRTTSNGQQTVRMTATWEFGDLLSSLLLGAVAETGTKFSGKGAFDASTMANGLLRNAPHIGLAYNRSAWLYADEIPYDGRRALFGQSLLFISAIFVLGVTALLFLWSFTRIAQQRLVVLRFFALLPAGVITTLVEQTEENVHNLQHPSVEVGRGVNGKESGDETGDETTGGETTDDETTHVGKKQHIPPLPPLPNAPTSPRSPHKGKTQVEAAPPLPKRSSTGSETELTEVVLTPPASSHSSGRLFWASAVPRRDSDEATSVGEATGSNRGGRSDQASDSPAKPMPTPAAPKVTVRRAPQLRRPQPLPQPTVSSKLVRVMSPQNEPHRANRAAQQNAPVQNRRVRTIGSARRAPYLVFALSGLIFLLVAVAVGILVASLTQMGRMELKTDNDVSAAATLSSLWLNRVLNTRQARKLAYFGQARRYSSYWDLDYQMQTLVNDLARTELPRDTLEIAYRAWYTDVPAVRTQEMIAMGLTAMCFNMSTSTMPEIMYQRWSADPNDNATDPITLLRTQTHADYYTDLSSPNSIQCRAARNVLFTDTFKTKLETATTNLLSASNAAQQYVNDKLDQQRQGAASSLWALIAVYALMLVVLAALAVELRHRHKILWQYRTARILLAGSVICVTMVIGTLGAALVVLNTEVNATETRIAVSQYVAEIGRGIDKLNTVSFEFSAFPDSSQYRTYWQTYASFNQSAERGLSLLPPSQIPQYTAVRNAHSFFLQLDFIALALAGDAAGLLNNDTMPELVDYDWNGRGVQYAHYRNRTYDFALSAAAEQELALKVLSDDLQTLRRNAVNVQLNLLQANTIKLANEHVSTAQTVRTVISWIVLGANVALGVVAISLGLVLALRALDMSGSQAISRLNDPTLNSHVRSHRVALGVIAAIFVGMLGTFAGVAQPRQVSNALGLAWVIEHGATAARCAHYASAASVAATNQSFSADARRLLDCTDRLATARHALFDANGGKTPREQLSTSLLPQASRGSASGGLYLLYTDLMAACSRLGTAPQAFGSAAADAFASVRELFRLALPLFSAAEQKVNDVLDSESTRTQALHFALPALLLVVLVFEYFLVFRPMLTRLLEDQAVMRTLLALVPEGSLTADMEEFLEKGAITHTDLLLGTGDNDDDDLAAGDAAKGMWAERVEDDADELKFMTAEVEAMSRSPQPALVCSPEGAVLWINKPAASLLPSDAVGQHLSLILPTHAALALRHGAIPPSGRHVAIRATRGSTSSTNPFGSVTDHQQPQNDAAVLRASAVQHPRTGQPYWILSLELVRDTAVATLRQQVAHGTRCAEACPEVLESHAAAVAVVNPKSGLLYCNSKMEKVLGKHVSALLGQDFRSFLMNPNSLPESDDSPGGFVPGGYDTLVAGNEGKGWPHFVHVQAVPSGEETLAVLCCYPLQGVTPQETSQGLANRSGKSGPVPSAGKGVGTATGRNSGPHRAIRQPKHTDLQFKRCTVLVAELDSNLPTSQTQAPQQAMAAATRSAKALGALFEAAAEHGGHLHWTMGDRAVITFNHSSANGAHVLSACGAATLLRNDPAIGPALRQAVSSSTAYCGYYGRLPVLQGECLATAELLLRVLKEVPSLAAVDQNVWQNAQYSYHTRLVNTATVLAVGSSPVQQSGLAPKVVAVYELGGPKQAALDEWMYQLAQAATPFAKYDEAVRHLRHGEVLLAKEALQVHIAQRKKLSADGDKDTEAEDEVAKWLLSLIEHRVEAVVPSRTEWCGRIPFKLDWALEQ